LRLVDLNTGNLTVKDWQWADLILLSAMYIQKDGFLALVREASNGEKPWWPEVRTPLQCRRGKIKEKEGV